MLVGFVGFGSYQFVQFFHSFVIDTGDTAALAVGVGDLGADSGAALLICLALVPMLDSFVQVLREEDLLELFEEAPSRLPSRLFTSGLRLHDEVVQVEAVSPE